MAAKCGNFTVLTKLRITVYYRYNNLPIYRIILRNIMPQRYNKLT